MATTFVTVEQAAPALGFKPHAVYRAIREGQFPFPFVKIGRQIRIDARAIGLSPNSPSEKVADGQAEARANAN